MQYNEIVKRVQERANLDSQAEAGQLIEVIITALAEPLSREETNRLASQLPGELKTLLARNREEPIPAKQTMQTFEVEEFYNRVKGRLGVSYQQGVEQVQAVMSVVREAVPQSIIASVLRDLPEGYSKLFNAQGQGR